MSQKIPNNWHKREALRERGQFWTPDWIAEAMVNYVFLDGSRISDVFDPGVGTGSFFRAAKKIANQLNKKV